MRWFVVAITVAFVCISSWAIATTSMGANANKTAEVKVDLNLVAPEHGVCKVDGVCSLPNPFGMEMEPGPVDEGLKYPAIK